MNSLFRLSRKRVLFIYFISFVVIVLLTSLGTRLVNNYYRSKIIDQENQEFIELFSHLVEFSTIDDAITVAEHYSHTNNAGIIIHQNDGVLYVTDEAPESIMTYEVDIKEDSYIFIIDNSDSYVAIIRDDEVFLINVIVFSVFSVLILYFVYSRHRRNQRTLHDLLGIQELLEKRVSAPHHFFFEEFHKIYHDILDDLNMIDLLNTKKSDNLHGLVHDLKTPITILKYHLEEDDIVKNKEAIIQSLNDLTQIASDLIAEKFQGQHRRINLSELLRKELTLYEPSFRSKKMVIKTKINDDIYVNFNKRDLSRVLQNLLTNAFYYSYEETTLFVNLIHNKDSYSLEILNQGEHLDDEKIEDIFSKRISDSEMESANGFGLYITKLLVEDANATIHVKSDDLGNNFIITFPKIKEDN